MPVTKPRRLRVVHVVECFDPSGSDKGLTTLIQHTTHVVDHVVLCATCSPDAAALLPAGVQLTVLDDPSGPSMGRVLRLARALRPLRPCIVHTQDWPGMSGLFAARMAGIRQVVHGEASFEGDALVDADRRHLLVRRLLASLPQEYICGSRPQERWLRYEVGVKRRVNRIMHGVDTHRFQPGDGSAMREALGLGPGPGGRLLLIGTVARFDGSQDIATLLAAFAKLREACPEARLLVVGDGPQRIRHDAKKPADVLFLGQRHDLPELLRAFDLYVLPSGDDGNPGPLLDAMATGLPTIASRTGGQAEWVDDGTSGTLVPDGDVQALLDAMLAYAHSASQRAQHGHQARRRVAKRFGVATLVAQYRALWQRLDDDR